jgi:hypothetical protein
VAANIVISGLTCWWLPAQKLPIAGSAALALSIAPCGLVFAGLSAKRPAPAVTFGRLRRTR